MSIAKKRKGWQWWQPKDKKEEDEEYDDDLGEEEFQTLFNTIYAE
jgi:hypothetical protein